VKTGKECTRCQGCTTILPDEGSGRSKGSYSSFLEGVQGYMRWIALRHGAC